MQAFELIRNKISRYRTPAFQVFQVNLTYMFFTTSLANSEHFNKVAPSIWRWKS